MHTVVFVAPFFLETTVRFVEVTAELPGVRCLLISQDPLERLAPAVRAKLAGHWRVDDAFDADQLTVAARGLAAKYGPIYRLFGALEQLQEPLAAARENLGLPGMSEAVARNFRDKSQMKNVLRANDIPCARHRLCATAEEAWDFVRQVGYPIVAKPPAGAGSKGTYRLDQDSDTREVLGLTRPTAAGPLLLEEFILGEEQSFDCVWIGGKLVWHSLTHYLPTPLDAVRNPWIQWCVLLPREIADARYDEIRRVGARAVEVLGMGTRLTHMEWFKRPDGSVAVSEVAARPPGAQITTLISWANDIDFKRAWAELMVFETFTPPTQKYAAGCAFLRGQGEGRVKAIHGLDQAQREVGDLVVEVNLPKPGQPKSSSYEGDGNIVVRHPETAVVEHALGRLIRLIRVEMG